ncbi:MAG: LLM class flavin-dependent oxidoreductase [Micromonosporaceae bacterium]
MRIGIGLPNPVPDTPGERLVEWGRRAEERGFAGLATIDRIAYPSHDSLATLAAVAGATSRIGLMTNILLAPVYPPALLAKTSATIDRISDGRLTLGLAPGSRADDYAVAGAAFDTRGASFDAALRLLHQAWAGEPIAGGDKPVTPGPTKDERVPVLIGGSGARAVRRAVEWGTGWTAGGGSAEMSAPQVRKVRDAWREAGRGGEPRLVALTYFSLGADAEDGSRAYLQDYYAFTGPYADRIADGALRTEQAIRDAVRAYADAGFTELYFDPTVDSLDQVDRLADLVL